MLASIALFPVLLSSFWDKNRNKLIIAVAYSIPVIVWLCTQHYTSELVNTLLYDYIPFIVLLGALFVITGGIFLEGDIDPKPSINTAFLGASAIMASFLGTTGAAMLLIRPLLRTNRERQYNVHTILFFIAIAANCGGLLTPLGDPPLFMMYLKGASFLWFFKLFPMWLFVNVSLLAIYYCMDCIFWKKEPDTIKLRVEEESERMPIRVRGGVNLLMLVGVILSVAFINDTHFSFIKPMTASSYIRELFISLMAVLSLLLTKKSLRQSNNYSWAPITEVAFLFLGIFITMIPCIMFLKNNAHLLSIVFPNQFYYSSGALSSFLDNTPTALTFHSLAVGLCNVNLQAQTVAGIPEILLKAISAGSVLFGSMTYIGNGPNFMVKSIAEEQGISMPGFFAYIYKFSLIVLLPLFILNQLLFL